ncbi:RNA-binding (RRM/RBD/RNP motifs) family protein [Rhynchospora pubera]|nr:RNA-binding (RRM/RBD/RNP motifs) family protein [Rhynchospora pubera]
MEADSGKLFIGGISWETNEDRLTEYFGRYGEVAEAVIMRDRVTGRARGFGFIVFADPAVAERVTMEKHMIDGRMVEAKKAVPRDDQSITGSKTGINASTLGSPGPGGGRTRKIFVGGLPSSITDSDFKLYFEQFGPISDVVVMYDQTTQRPRGFGFITFDSDDSVDRVLAKSSFHHLNGKLVEVKRAVPKDLSPGPNGPAHSRSPIPSPASPLGRVNTFLNGYGSGPSPIGSYGMRVDGRYGLLSGGRNGLSSFGHGGYGVGMGIEPLGMNPGFGGGSSFNASPGYGRQVNSGSYPSNRYSSLNTPVGYTNVNDDTRSVFARNLWGNSAIGGPTVNPGNPNSFVNSAVRSLGPFDNSMSSNNNSSSGNNGLNWMGQVGGESNSNSFGLVGGPTSVGGYGRTDGMEMGNRSFDNNGYEVKNHNPELYGGSDSIYGDKTWSFATTELDASGPFSYMENYKETSRGISS